MTIIRRRAAYIVNIVYAALLLVVLFERVVAVKFPEERHERAWEGWASSNDMLR